MKSRIIKNCQICNSTSLNDILNLGYIAPVNNVVHHKINNVFQTKYQAKLLKCSRCDLVQLSSILDKKIIFPKSYPYTSSTTKILSDNFKELYSEIKRKFNFKNKDLVVDIGSNDGNLLEKFKNFFNVIGVTPELIGKLAIKKGVPTLIRYFDKKAVDIILKRFGKASVITATNVFAHMDNVNSVIQQIKRLMQKDSIFVSESHYLLPLIKNIQYDTVYHEHMRYYSLKSLSYLFKKNNLQIFDAKTIPTHGGSIRVYACKINQYKVTSNVKKILNSEKKHLTFKNFDNKVLNTKIDLLKILNNIKKKNKSVAGISAPSRGTTLINYTGIDYDLVKCIFEIKGSKKIGNLVPGTNIPIIEEKANVLKKFDYLIIFSWHIKKEIIKNLKRKGFRGKFILPLPIPKIVSK